MLNPDELPIWVLVFGLPILLTLWYMLETKERRIRNHVIRHNRQNR